MAQSELIKMILVEYQFGIRQMGTLFSSSISFFTRLVASTDFSAPFCGALIIFIEPRRKQIRREAVISMQRKRPTYPLKSECNPVQFDHDREKSE